MSNITGVMGGRTQRRARLGAMPGEDRVLEDAAAALDAAMPALQGWIGRARVAEEEVALGAVRRIAATFDLDPAEFGAGTPLPPHWFNLFFADVARQSALGPDGHPRKGEFLPPIPLPRRMGAGRRVRLHGALRVGDAATKRTEVAAIRPKAARTGPICILTMRSSITARGAVLAVEEFDAIYRAAVAPGAATAATAPIAPPTEASWQEARLLDPTQVFRYGAITWNAHRIHYDADYARGEEGYPAAVMNGGLTMHLLLDAALRNARGRLVGYETRLMRPLFVGDTARFCGSAIAEGRMQAWVMDTHGAQAAEMTLEFEA